VRGSDINAPVILSRVGGTPKARTREGECYTQATSVIKKGGSGKKGLNTATWYLSIGVVVSQVMMDKIDHIESLLMEINSKLDNFIGFEDLEPGEEEEVETIQQEIASGEFVSSDEVLGDR
jgi:hypothetical protein